MSTVLPPQMENSRQSMRPAPATHARAGMPRFIRLSAMALALTGVAAFGVIVYSAYQGGPATPDQVPLITADNSPLRERPAEEGGMTVANRDSTVYSHMDGSTPQPGLERLIPPPEQPLNPVAPETLAEPRRPDGTPALTPEEIRIIQQQRRVMQQQRGDAGEQAMQQLAEAASQVPAGVAQGHTSTVLAQQAERIEPPAAPAPVAPAPQVLGEVPAVSVRPTDSRIVTTNTPAGVIPNPAGQSPARTAALEVPTLEEQPIATLSQAQIVAQGTRPRSVNPAERPAVVAAAPTAQEERQAAAVAPAAGAGTRLIQLGAVRTEESARAEWRRLQTKYRSQIGSLQLEVQQVDLGARGIYWRIRGASVSEAQGKQICEQLKAAGQSCLVVSR